MEEGGRRRENSKEEEEDDVPSILVQDHAQALPWRRLLWHLGHWKSKREDAVFLGAAVENGDRAEVGKQLKWRFARQVINACMLLRSLLLVVDAGTAPSC